MWVEKSYPYIGGAIVGALWWHFDLRLPKDPSALLSSSLTLGAILTGFLATSKTILIGLRGSSVMETLQDSKYIRELIQYLAEAIWLSFAFSLLVLLGFFLKNTSDYFFDTLWAALGVMAALAFVRVTYIILLVIRRPDSMQNSG
jgi:hypothetical protein